MKPDVPIGISAEDVSQRCKEAGLTPSEGQIDSLMRFLNLLQRWSRTYNLTAVRDAAGIEAQHLVDCLAVIRPLQRHTAGGALLDVGSGGGLPAAVIAILLPEWQVTSVDAVGKKVAFIRQVAALLSLANLRAEHARVESLHAGPFDVVTSRAFASLHDFARLSQHLLRPNGGVWMAMKGKVPVDEIGALPTGITVFHVEQLVVPTLDAARCLVWMKKSPDKPSATGEVAVHQLIR